MKIFSNFDTKLKRREFDKRTKVYWAEEVLLLSKSKLFRSLRIDSPFFTHMIGIIVMLFFFNERVWREGVLWWALPLVVISTLFVAPKILKHLMDYHMDFIIITPKQLLRYDQEGILRRDVITINVNSIKTVSVRKKWLLYSVFNNWDIVFLSEGDVDHGEILLEYIHKPEDMKHRIAQIMKRH